MSKKVYLDFNVIASIENCQLSVDSICEVINNHDVRFPYSPAHIQETDNITNESESQKKQFIFNRLYSIRQISQCWYLFHDLTIGKVVLKNEEPAVVLETIREVPLAKSAIATFVNLLTPDMKATIRTEIGLDSKLINNYEPDEVIQHLSKKLVVSLANMSFMELIEKAIQYHPDGKTFGLPHRISAIFELLDMRKPPA